MWNKNAYADLQSGMNGMNEGATPSHFRYPERGNARGDGGMKRNRIFSPSELRLYDTRRVATIRGSFDGGASARIPKIQSESSKPKPQGRDGKEDPTAAFSAIASTRHVER
mmetsp:Transcript_8854/g.21796  ORF Transcript_8854/g.21796 Transcript_8854/m.21796 type:complete len:111 (-) Transcript_8854:256-588(-)